MGKKKRIPLAIPTKLSAFYKRYIRIVPGIKSYAVATALVFILGMTITLLSWYVDRQRVDTLRTAELNDQAAAVESDIKGRLVIYEQILRGVSGLINSSDTSFTNDKLRSFVQQYDLPKTYPGIQGVGYIEHVTAAELPDYVTKIHQTFPEAEITPAGNRSEYALMTSFEPFAANSQKLIGYDILTDPTRASLAQQVRDSGKVGISQKTQLLSADSRSPSGQPGFTMYIATYKKGTDTTTVENRRANLGGYVYAAYRTNNFFSQAMDKASFSAYKDIRIFDGNTTDSKALLYQSTDFGSISPNDTSKTFETTIFNRPWTIQFANPMNSGSEDSQRSNMILFGGTTISFAIAGFLFLMMLTRARAIVYSKQNEAQQAKDDLLSLASHQLRTPATAVKQYLGMILEGYTGNVNKKQLPALQKAYASNERQLDTINQILYVAKADAGRLSVNPDTFDVTTLVDEIILDLSDMLHQNSQTVQIEHTVEKLTLHADEASIRMVVENLISNASKYSYQDSKITIKTGQKNNEVYIAITDEGVGITNDDRDKLFKKFSRIDNDLSLQVGGSGIGLYIDKVLIELHKGRIAVDSELGQGSTFTIYLPKGSANNLTDEGG